MKTGQKLLFAFSFFGLLTGAVHAQLEKIHTADVKDAELAFPSVIRDAKNPYLKAYLQSPLIKTERQKTNAVKLAKDAAAAKADSAQVIHYAVPAMSDLQRLPDTYPSDGKAMGPVRIIMAQDEYEPGSFVVFPLKDFGKVELKLSQFKADNGAVFPADKLDLKVIKVWYQNGNGWYSYFGDTELKLCPELLLNDEDLIKVDEKNVQNYARLTEKDGKQSFVWLTPPRETARRYSPAGHINLDIFQCMKENFCDAKTIQPVSFDCGRFKQFFLTAHTPKDQKPGLYKGSIDLVTVKGKQKIGTIPVTIKVMPFVLPKPGTYRHPEKPFLVSSYTYTGFGLLMQRNGGDLELAKRQYLAALKNMVEHNQDLYIMGGNMMSYEYDFALDLMKQAGMRTDYAMGGAPAFSGSNSPEPDIAHDARMLKQYYMKKLGHTNVFLGIGDEPPASWVLEMRHYFESLQKEGLKIFIAGNHQVYFAAGYMYDFFNTAQNPEEREASRRWNEIDYAYVAWYACQHVGVENPAYNRAQNGLPAYLSGYSALCNYAHHFDSYNDRSEGYKPMVLAYGCGTGVLDTLQWEGFREGVDDIRYATLLKVLAMEAQKSPDVTIRHKGRQALQFMSEINLVGSDWNQVRLEMIRRIMMLKKALNR